MKKRIVLCADDYGQALPISNGILELVSKQRLSAVSCLVNESDWQVQAKALAPFCSQVDVGLHFNLTQGVALSKEYQAYYGEYFKPLTVVMLKSILRNFRREIIECECHAQLDDFESAFGFAPHFLDGHQHIHQFPVIREAVARVYRDRLDATRTYMRLTEERTSFIHMSTSFKKRIIAFLSGRHLSDWLSKHNIIHNQSFAGSYPFQYASHYRGYFLKFLERIEDNGLIMCHPGFRQPLSVQDPIALARYHEYQYFNSDQFLQDCIQYGVEFGRFFDIINAI